MLLVCIVRGEPRERRKARYLAQLSAQYRKARPALPAGEPKQPESPNHKVTVEELVTRLTAEGLPVRLRWDEDGERRSG